MVSIIVPCYNGEKYLWPCLESVATQSYANWELIFINDGSTDRSLEIAQDFQKQMEDPERLVIISQENRGLPASRNRGMRHAKGQMVFFLDCDDWIEPKAIEKLMEAMEREPEIDFAWMGFRQLYQHTGKVRTYRYPYLLKDRVINGKVFFLEYLSNKYMIAMGNGMYRKTMLEKQGIVFDESMARSEDISFEMDVFLRCRKVASTPYCGFTYRLHRDSMVHEDREKQRQEFIAQKDSVSKRMEQIRRLHSKKAALLHEIVFANVYYAALDIEGPYRRHTLIPTVLYWLRHPILRRHELKWNCKRWRRSWSKR